MDVTSVPVDTSVENRPYVHNFSYICDCTDDATSNTDEMSVINRPQAYILPLVCDLSHWEQELFQLAVSYEHIDMMFTSFKNTKHEAPSIRSGIFF